jgi:hypothetical protein
MMSRINMSVGDAGCGEGESGVMGKYSRMRCKEMQDWLLDERTADLRFL